MGDVDHFLGNDAGTGKFELRHQRAGLPGPQRAPRRTGGGEMVGVDIAIVLGTHRAPLDGGVATRGDPRLAQRWQAGGQIDRRRLLAIGP